MMLRLFHGSVEIVTNPIIIEPERPLDFGKGFYTTTSFDQALDWAKRRAKAMNKQRYYVNEFVIIEDVFNKLKHLQFNSPTDEWIEFVLRNRTNINFNHDYDVISGPVANDRVYAAFALYESGFIDKNQLLLQLRTYNLVDQYLFHTEESLEALTHFTSKLIDR